MIITRKVEILLQEKDIQREDIAELKNFGKCLVDNYATKGIIDALIDEHVDFECSYKEGTCKEDDLYKITIK